jgi:hypothetical protein
VTITSDLLEKLRDHYIEPGATWPGGVFADEIGNNGEWGKGRRCDALYAGFTSQSGRILIGHEVKVSRADWNHERDNPGKADQWADQCHAWYLVAPSVAIIPADEVPPGWGLMVPNPRAKRRFQIVVKAAIHKDRNPSWPAVRSFMARMDTMREKAMERAISEQVERRMKPVLDRYNSLEANPADRRELEALRSQHSKIEEALGIKLGDWDNTWSNTIGPETLAVAIKLTQAMQALAGPHRTDGLEGLLERLATVSTSIGHTRKAATDLRAHLLELAK